MFNHKNFALNGLFPGLVSTRSVANLGHFEIEVIIEPVYPQGGGGGYVPRPLNDRPTKYRIVIRITRNGKTWKYEQIVSTAVAKVTAKLIGKTLVEPTVSVVNTSMVQQNEVKVTANVNSKIKT